MSHATKPHTTLAFTHEGRLQTLSRPGHLAAPVVTAFLAARGVQGAVTIRHHAAAMFGKAGATVSVIKTEVR